MITQTTSLNFRRFASTCKTVQGAVFEARLSLTLDLLDKVGTLRKQLDHLIDAHKQLMFSNSIQIDEYALLLAYTSSAIDRSLDVYKATDTFVQSLKSLKLSNSVSKYLSAQNLKQKEAISNLNEDVASDLHYIDYHSENLPPKYLDVPMECHIKFFQAKSNLADKINRTIYMIVQKVARLMFAAVHIIEEARDHHDLYDQLLGQANEIHAQALKMHDEAKEFIERIKSIVSKRCRPFLVTTKMKQVRLERLRELEDSPYHWAW